MSWTENFLEVSYGDLAALSPVNEVTTAAVDQFQAAVAAVKVLMESDSTGDHSDSDVKWNIHMNGHQNEDHYPPSGWTTDTISLNIVRTNRNDPN